MADDTRPIDPSCECTVWPTFFHNYGLEMYLLFIFLLRWVLQVCKTYSRAYIHCLATKEAMGSVLISYHNLYYMMKVCLHDSLLRTHAN